MVEFDLDFQDAIREVEEKGAKATAAEWLARVEAEYGTAPLIYKKLEDSPEALISHLLYKTAVNQMSSLEPRVVELISLAVGQHFAVITVRHITCRLQRRWVFPRRRYWRLSWLQDFLQTHPFWQMPIVL